MEVIKLKENKSIKKDISKLYLSAFPKNERPPFGWFYKCLFRYKENEVLGFYDKGKFIGFVEYTQYKNFVYIAFLAVQETKRGQGYGTKILQYIKDNFADKSILLCYEEVDKKYHDYIDRKKREEFYQRNGFIDNELKTNEAGVIYQSAVNGKEKANFEDYKNIFDFIYGKGSNKLYLKEYFVKK